MQEDLIPNNFKDDNKNTFEEADKKKFEFNFEEYKATIYTALFYLFGLFLGSYFYKIVPLESINNLIKPAEHSILSIFASNFCIYFSVFLIVMFLGFCLIGYPIVNIIPTVIGIATGVKCAYFFINYQVKGVGYALIMLIPFAAMFITIISYTIQISADLSKKLLKMTKKENTDDFNVKPSVKKYLLLALFIVITSLTEACLTNLLCSVVTI